MRPDPTDRGPEKLALPAGAVVYLLELALRTQLGEAWWKGFTTAHGEPSWVHPGPGGERGFVFRVGDGAVVRTPPAAADAVEGA